MSAEAQTDDADLESTTAAELRFDGWEASPPVLDFLRRAMPLMEAELADNGSAASVALDVLAQEAGADDDDDRGLLHTLAVRFRQIQDDAARAKTGEAGADAAPASLVALRFHGSHSAFTRLPVSGVSWNATGALVAAAFGCLNHNGWCTHRAGIAVWNAFKRPSRGGAGGGGSSSSPRAAGAGGSSSFSFGSDGSGGGGAGAGSSSDIPAAGAGSAGSSLSGFIAEGGHGMRPDIVIEWPACVTCVAFHPTQPSLLAAGTQSGEVLLFDVNRPSEAAGEPIARSRSDDYLHRECVTALRWVQEPVLRLPLLVSASAEGKVQIWSTQNGLAFPLAGFQLSVRPKARASAAGGDDDGALAGRRGGDEDDGAGAGGRGGAGDRGRGGRAMVPAGVTALDFPCQGGAPLPAASAFVVGSEAGTLHRCAAQLQPQALDSALAEWHAALAAAAGTRPAPRPGGASGPAYAKPGAVSGAETTLPWERAAVAVLTRLPPGERAAAARAVERHAREVGATTVPLRLLYGARAEPLRKAMFPNPAVLEYSASSAMMGGGGGGAAAAHAAPVLALACSPFHRAVFASGGGDGRLCLFASLAQAPLLVLEPGLRTASSSSATGRADAASSAGGGGAAGGAPSTARSAGGAAAGATSGSSTAAGSGALTSSGMPAVLALAWSRARPCVLAAATGDGAVSVFDLFASTGAPAAVLRVDGSYDGAPSHASGSTAVSGAAAAGPGTPHADAAVAALLDAGGMPAATAVAFNPKQRRLLAVGDAAGRLHIWKLAWRLGAEQPQELRALSLFSQTAVRSDGGDASAVAVAADKAVAEPPNSLAAFKAAMAKKMDAARDLL